jgi:hypothetical protein
MLFPSWSYSRDQITLDTLLLIPANSINLLSHLPIDIGLPVVS